MSEECTATPRLFTAWDGIDRWCSWVKCYACGAEGQQYRHPDEGKSKTGGRRCWGILHPNHSGDLVPEPANPVDSGPPPIPPADANAPPFGERVPTPTPEEYKWTAVADESARPLHREGFAGVLPAPISLDPDDA